MRIASIPGPPRSCSRALSSMTAASSTVGSRGSDFAELGRLVRAAELLRRRPWTYVLYGSLVFVIYGAACVSIGFLGDSWWQLIAAVVLGVAFTQAAFLGHDGGHHQGFGSRRFNDLFGQLTGNLLIGLSYGWWVGKHNRHHASPNREDHDPDIGDGVPAFTTGQAANRTGWIGRAILRRQAWLFFPMLTLEGFQLHIAAVQSLLPGGQRHSRGGARRSEVALLTLHLVIYVGGLLLVMSPWKAVAFIAIHQAVFGLYMGCSFAPNHEGMRIVGADEDIDYLRRQVLTSRNVRGGLFVDWLLGGLNYQVEHHLFPNMPRPALDQAQRLVRDHCDARQISYTDLADRVLSRRAALSERTRRSPAPRRVNHRMHTRVTIAVACPACVGVAWIPGHSIDVLGYVMTAGRQASAPSVTL